MLDKPKRIVITISICLVIALIVGTISYIVYVNSERTKGSLLVQYFKAVSQDDKAMLKAITHKEPFYSDLESIDLSSVSYELYEISHELGEKSGTIKFILLVSFREKEKTAYIAEMHYTEANLANKIDSIQFIEKGLLVGE